MRQAPVTDATAISISQKNHQDFGDLLLEVRPGYGSTIRNLSAREALSKAAKREISEDDYEEAKERLVALGLVRKGRGRGSALGLAEGIEAASSLRI